MRISDLLSNSSFCEFDLIAGANGRNAEISSVNVIDSPDSFRFFRGGELLLTNTYIMRDDPSLLLDFVRECARIGTAGLCIKLGRFLQDFPQEFISLADSLDFPIILLPVDIPFEQIITYVYGEILNDQVKARHRDEFIQGLLLGVYETEEQIVSREQLYGWDFSKGIMTLLLQCEEKGWHIGGVDLGKTITRLMRKAYPHMMHTQMGAELLYLIGEVGDDMPLFRKQQRETLGKMIQEIERAYPITIHVGISSHKNTIMLTRKSYEEAKLAAKLGARTGIKISQYDELGIYRLLDGIRQHTCAEEFVQKYLGALIQYDERHHTEYLKTLRNVAECDYNLKEAAEHMYIHYNTIKYRMAKISEITGLDFSAYDDKLGINIALKLLQLG